MLQGRRLQVDVNDIALKLEDDRMELEQRLRLEVRHGIGLDGTPNAMLCYAMPCLQLQLTLHLFRPKRKRSGNSGVDFSTSHQPAMHLYRPLCSSQHTMNGDQGGRRDSPRGAFCVWPGDYHRLRRHLQQQRQARERRWPCACCP